MQRENFRGIPLNDYKLYHVLNLFPDFRIDPIPTYSMTIQSGKTSKCNGISRKILTWNNVGALDSSLRVSNMHMIMDILKKRRFNILEFRRNIWWFLVARYARTTLLYYTLDKEEEGRKSTGLMRKLAGQESEGWGWCNGAKRCQGEGGEESWLSPIFELSRSAWLRERVRITRRFIQLGERDGRKSGRRMRGTFDRANARRSSLLIEFHRPRKKANV